MKMEHYAVASRTEEESERFYVHLLGLKKIREFNVSAELMKALFGLEKSSRVIRYADEEMDIEVFITDDESQAQDTFTHGCILVAQRDDFLRKAQSQGFKTRQVPKPNTETYHLFIKDSYGNNYEVKER